MKFIARTMFAALGLVALAAGPAKAQGFFPELLSFGTEIGAPNAAGERIIKITDPAVLKGVEPGFVLIWAACHHPGGTFFVVGPDNTLVVMMAAKAADCPTLNRELEKRFGV